MIRVLCMYYVLDLKWALIVGLTVANIMDHKAQLQNMAIEEVFRHQMGGVERCDPLRLRVEEGEPRRSIWSFLWWMVGMVVTCTVR